jgi:hypothetical protein
MQKVIDYRQKAAECRTLAHGMLREVTRESLLALARSWDHMADRRETALRTR